MNLRVEQQPVAVALTQKESMLQKSTINQTSSPRLDRLLDNNSKDDEVIMEPELVIKTAKNR